MSVQSSIEDTTESIISALANHDLSDSEKEEVKNIVTRLLVKTVRKTTKNQVMTAAQCCGLELDLAHQIEDEMHRKRDLLISNLKAMR